MPRRITQVGLDTFVGIMSKQNRRGRAALLAAHVGTVALNRLRRTRRGINVGSGSGTRGYVRSGTARKFHGNQYVKIASSGRSRVRAGRGKGRKR